MMRVCQSLIASQALKANYSFYGTAASPALLNLDVRHQNSVTHPNARNDQRALTCFLVSHGACRASLSH